MSQKNMFKFKFSPLRKDRSNTISSSDGESSWCGVTTRTDGTQYYYDTNYYKMLLLILVLIADVTLIPSNHHPLCCEELFFFFIGSLLAAWRLFEDKTNDYSLNQSGCWQSITCHIFIELAIFAELCARLPLQRQYIPLVSSGHCLNLHRLLHGNIKT